MGVGSYADAEVGEAACTGNGDIMMRFLPGKGHSSAYIYKTFITA